MQQFDNIIEQTTSNMLKNKKTEEAIDKNCVITAIDEWCSILAEGPKTIEEVESIIDESKNYSLTSKKILKKLANASNLLEALQSEENMDEYMEKIFEIQEQIQEGNIEFFQEQEDRNSNIYSILGISKITDKEMTPLYEASKDRIDVDENIQEQHQDETSIDMKSAIESTEVDGIYIENGVLMQVDKEYTEIAMEAQAKGEDPEKALEEYITRKELEAKKESQEQTEEKAETDIEKADSIPEIIVVDETQESVEQDSSLDGNSQLPEELTNESPVKDDTEGKKNENFVVMKKGKNGKIQVLRPFQYSHHALIGFDQVIQEQKALAQIIETERINGISGPVTEEQSQNNENNMNLENEDARE